MKCIDFIDGKTGVLGIIGNPIEHTFSPVLQNTIASVLKHNFVLVPFEVKKGHVKTAIDGAFELGIKGMCVTIPHKQEVIEALVDIDEKAKQIGAVNMLKRVENGFKGFNTDIIGLKKSLEMKNILIKNKKILILGAGGAARSVGILAASENAKEIFIANRTIEKAVGLADDINKYYGTDIKALSYDEAEKLSDINIIIQATSVGMSSTTNQSPIQNKNIFKGVDACFDIIYSPWETEFLKSAAAMGITAINGFDMLIYQGIAGYEIWNDIKIENNIAEEIKYNLTHYYRNL